MQAWHQALLDLSVGELAIESATESRATASFSASDRSLKAQPSEGPVATPLSARPLRGTALVAWRSYLQSYATIVRDLDADLTCAYGVTTRDYQVLLYLAECPDRQLTMSALADRTMLTRSGITRLVDGLVANGLIERASCPRDGRVFYAQLTDAGLETLRRASDQHIAGIRRLFLEHYTEAEVDELARLLSRLPGSSCS